MKKQILILSLSALILFGCAGKGNHNSSNNQPTVDTVTTENVEAIEEDDDMYQLPSVPDSFFEFVKNLPQTPDQQVYHVYDSYEIEEQFCEINEDSYALPMKDGGYMAMYSYNSQCEATMEWYDSTFICKNGEINKVGNILPVPEMRLMLDSEKCKGREAQVQDIIAQYNKHPQWYLLYGLKDNGALIVSAEGNGCEQWGEIDLELMRDIVYQWDGEKFVLQPLETATIAEDIFTQRFPNIEEASGYYPLSYSGGYDPGCEGCYSSEGVYCYPLKDGGFLVISESCFAGPGCAGSYTYATHTYKDGVFDTISDILPLPELELLLNPSKTDPYKAEIADFKENYYDKAPFYHVNFDFTPPLFLNVELYPYDCEETYAGMDETRWSSYRGDKTPKYLWNGEGFVKE